MGIDLGGTKIYAVVLDAQGRVVWDRRIATPAGDYAATLDALVALVVQARQVCGPCSIGIGTPGTVMPGGLMKNSNSECLNGRPLLADLSARLKQPVQMANDANCLALSEASDGAGAGAQVVFAVILGTGTGAGIAVHGRVLTGPNGLAGEWGHNPLPWAVPGSDPVLRCYCGQNGCIETVLSGPGMARDHLAHTGAALSAEQIAQAALRGDAACAATLQRYCNRLARALAGIINLLDPDVIVRPAACRASPCCMSRCRGCGANGWCRQARGTRCARACSPARMAMHQVYAALPGWAAAPRPSHLPEQVQVAAADRQHVAAPAQVHFGGFVQPT
jgi:fructokinase